MTICQRRAGAQTRPGTPDKPVSWEQQKQVDHQPTYARATAMADTDEDGEEVPGLLEMLARVADPRKKRGQRYRLAFVLAVAVACALTGARNFRELGDQAQDLPQEVLARLGGRPHPLHRKIIAPSEKRLRTGNGPQVVATLRNIAISLLHLAGVTEIARTLQAITCDRTRMLSYLSL
ncbi:MAG: transposase family protein [Trebonia sp.]